MQVADWTTERRKTRQISVGEVAVGGDAPITVQSMTITKTADVEGTLQQIYALAAAGCDIVRCTCNEAGGRRRARPDRAALADPGHRRHPPPVQDGAGGDAGRRARACASTRATSGAPSTSRPSPARPATVACRSASASTPDRSIPSCTRSTAGRHPRRWSSRRCSEIAYFDEVDFDLVKISVKASSVPLMVEAYRQLSAVTDFPLHLGVTEAGPPPAGLVKGTAGIATLLMEGIGDTIRYSLTADPVEEARAGRQLLEALGLRERKNVDLIACPSCGRAEVDVIDIAQRAMEAFGERQLPLQVAVMGCVVNGPGEAREADLGIAAGNKRGHLFVKGRNIAVVPESEMVEALVEWAEFINEHGTDAAIARADTDAGRARGGQGSVDAARRQGRRRQPRRREDRRDPQDRLRLISPQRRSVRRIGFVVGRDDEDAPWILVRPSPPSPRRRATSVRRSTSIPDTVAKAKSLGLDGFRMYFLGRGGVLGDVEPAVVSSAFGYFEPGLLAHMWNTAKAVMPPRDAARAYMAANHDLGRAKLADVAGLDEYADAAAAVVDSVDVGGYPLFAGVRAEPVPDDAPGAGDPPGDGHARDARQRPSRADPRRRLDDADSSRDQAADGGRVVRLEGAAGRHRRRPGPPRAGRGDDERHAGARRSASSTSGRGRARRRDRRDAHRAQGLVAAARRASAGDDVGGRPSTRRSSPGARYHASPLRSIETSWPTARWMSPASSRTSCTSSLSR